MTDPDMADARARQEGRAPREIPNEISMNIARLKRIGIRREQLKYYQGTPTVFAIVTTDRMSLNPYLYETEVFTCFSLIVCKTLNADSDIFHQYLNYHFENPWEHAREIIPSEWNNFK